jgi:5-methylcytosine-specific restriction enzyme A
VTVFRRQKVPLLYTQLPFVRQAPPSGLADCAEDLEYLKRIQLAASGKECISTLEASHQLMIRIDFPDNVLEHDGTSGNLVKWFCWYWKAWDVEYLFKDGQPAEAVPIQEAGIITELLDSIAEPRSCISFLEDVEILFTEGSRKGYTLERDMRKSIQKRENKLLAARRISMLKGLSHGRRHVQSNPEPEPILPLKVREKVLRRDSYRCIFCGTTAQESKLEVNHIIPKSIIRKLSLSAALFTDESNLCTTCWSCNRSKRDMLQREDITFYIRSFSNPNHPNNGIIHFLEAVRTLQGFGQ